MDEFCPGRRFLVILETPGQLNQGGRALDVENHETQVSLLQGTRALSDDAEVEVELQAVVIGHLGCQFAQAIEYSRCRRLLVLILYTDADAFTKDSEQQMESTMALTICENKVPSSELISQLTSF